MVTPEYHIVCTRNERIARNIHELKFEKPQGFTFAPGQFVLFDVPLIEDPADVQTRALSISSAPDENALVFVMKLKSNGRISRWITEVLHKGTETTMKGPFGFFALDQRSLKDFLFVATSTGVGPFRSQIKWVLSQGDQRPMDLVFGVRSEEDLFWQEEFQHLSQQHQNFSLHLALSQPSDSWRGHRGRVQTLVPQIVRDFSTKVLYACGSPEMTKEVKELAVREWGIAREDIHVEGYI